LDEEVVVPEKQLEIKDDFLAAVKDVTDIVIDGVMLPGKLANTLGNLRVWTSSIPLSSTDRRGFLFKMGGISTQWKRRWFVLKPPHSGSPASTTAPALYYAPPEVADATENMLTKGESTFTPNGCIILENLTFTPNPPEASGRAFAFALSTPKRKYVISAETREEFESWSRAIMVASGIEKDVTERKNSRESALHIARGDVHNVVREVPLDNGDQGNLQAPSVTVEISTAEISGSISGDVGISLEEEVKRNSATLERPESSSRRSSPNSSGKSSPSSTVQKGPGISESESRYFSKFGLTAPAPAPPEPEEDIPPEDAPLLMKASEKPKSGGCCIVL